MLAKEAMMELVDDGNAPMSVFTAPYMEHDSSELLGYSLMACTLPYVVMIQLLCTLLT